MAIVFDNATGAAGTGVSSLQWTHTVGAIAAFVALGSNMFNTTGASTGSLNNVALTLKGTETVWGTGLTAKLFTGSAVASGNLTASVTTTGGVAISQAAVICTYLLVNSSAPFGQVSSATATGTVSNFSISSTAGSTCIGFGTGIIGSGSPWTLVDPQTNRKTVSDGSGLKTWFSEKGALGSTTSFSFSSGSALTQWGFLGLAMTASSVAATFPSRGAFVLLGVGL